jgi:hypothetical protein
MPDVNTSNDTAMHAEVNAPQLVELFNIDGKGIRVPATDTEYWIRQGFSYQRYDPLALLENFLTLWPAVEVAIKEYVDSVVEDGEIDTSDVALQMTANKAMGMLIEVWDTLQRTINSRYPVKQAEPTKMYEPMIEFKDEDGRTAVMPWMMLSPEQRKGKPRQWHERNVDPGQVNYYRSAGWTTEKPKEAK